MSLQPFTLFSFNISACGFVLVGLKKSNNNNNELICIARIKYLQMHTWHTNE